MPDCSANPIAAGVPDSGTGITRSASAGCSRASRRPTSTRAAWTLRPEIVVSGRARYTYSNRQPFGWGAANRSDRRPSASIASSSPGSISRTTDAPTMSSAAVSLATTQPRSNRPNTSGRTPCSSRAAYSVCSSMNTSENAPRRVGSTSSAAASIDRSGRAASSAVIRSESVVVPDTPGTPAAAARTASSAVFTRLPLWPSARPVPALVVRKVGCAFSQVLEPVVEYRVWPIAMSP